MNPSEENATLMWERVCDTLRVKSEALAEQVQTQFKPLTLSEESLLLGASDDFVASWIMDNNGDELHQAIAAVTGKELPVSFEYGHLPELPRNTAPQKEDSLFQPFVDPFAEDEFSVSAAASCPIRLPSSPENCAADCRFDTFVVGEENRYAYTAAMTAAQQPGKISPLFIYGGTGMGKTHLIQAVANEAFRANPRTVIRYTSCEAFLNAYVDSLRNGSPFDFRERFRNVDFFLVDDVHHLGGKTGLQEEFFNTFNTLHNAGKQIILTADKQPAEIPGLEERLVSRFQSGISTQITPLLFETRLAILRKQQESIMVRQSDEILEYIASRITSNIRPLKSALLQLSMYATATGQPITRGVVEEVLGNLFNHEAESRKVSIDDILRGTAEFFERPVHDLTGPKRPKNIAEPRMMAMYLGRKLTTLSHQEIGQAFGGRNHATVIHAVKQIEKMASGNEDFRRTLASLQQKIQTKQ